MNNVNQSVEFLQTGENQNKQPNKQKGILVYQEAKIKLQISKSGKLYKQKITSYIPFIGPLFSLIYANLCVGKTRCLRSVDSKKFKSAGRSANWFGFILWPIIFLGIWTLLQYLLLDFGGVQGSYVAMWEKIIEGWKSQQIINAETGLTFTGSIFSGLFTIFVQPFAIIDNVMFSTTFGIPSNLIFIVSLLILTIINPINIFNSIVFNKKTRRFVVVLEDSSVYQYRNN